MVKFFSVVQQGIYDILAKRGFELKSADEANGISDAIYANEDMAYKLEYNDVDKKFYLYRGTATERVPNDDFQSVSVYLFEPAAGEENEEAAMVVCDFKDSLESKTSAKKSMQSRAASQKEKESDETGAVFFVNRFPSIMPETKDPLMAHKQHYGILLPNNFCEQCVSKAIYKLVDENEDKQKMAKVFEFLSQMYHDGDLDVKAIIVQTLLAKFEKEIHVEIVESYLSEELKKAWTMGKRYYGKELPPEKMTATQKLLAANAEMNNRLGQQ